MWKPPIGTRETADFLIACREKKGMSQQDAANMAAINIRNYEQFEDGVRHLANANFVVAMSVCKALDIMPDELFFKCGRDGMLDECLYVMQ